MFLGTSFRVTSSYVRNYTAGVIRKKVGRFECGMRIAKCGIRNNNPPLEKGDLGDLKHLKNEQRRST